MNYILMSIRARYAEMILSGRKTLEIRKTAPRGNRQNCEYTVLLYESKQDGGRGLIVGSFSCRSIQPVEKMDLLEVERRSCLCREDLETYAERPQRVSVKSQEKGWDIYAWSVENPVRFEKPMPLQLVGVSCPPQSWRTLKKSQNMKIGGAPNE